MTRFTNWIKKVLADSIIQALSKVIYNILTLVLIPLIPIVVISLYKSVNKTVQIPLFILIILALFSLIGIISQLKIIFSAIKPSKKGTTNKTKLVSIEFEDSPREWKARVQYDGFEWKSNSPNVYCTIHKLKLTADLYQVSDNGYFYTSFCADCNKLKKCYYETGIFVNHPGLAIHCGSTVGHKFFKEVTHRIERQATTEED
jgi:hypothetical protein